METTDRFESEGELTGWNGRRVFLTGHTGFKGGWLSLWLQILGAVVHGYALDPPTTPSLFEEARVGVNMESSIGDVRDYVSLSAALTRFEPEVIFHLAAQPLVRYSYLSPLETYAVNVMGTANLLEAARACSSVRAVVVITTDKCYENRDWPWPYRETDTLGGHDPYSNSKACAELVAGCFRDSFFPPHRYADHRVAVATARAGNVIGGGDWAADRLVPDMMRAFSDGRALRIRNPLSVRPWQHVLEPLRGYLMLAAALLDEGPRFGSAWNFGPGDGDARTVLDVVARMAALWGPGASWMVDDAVHPHEAAQLRLDCSKAAVDLQWRPRLDLEQALVQTARWYSAWRNGEDMKALTLSQIEEYSLLHSPPQRQSGAQMEAVQ